MKQNAVASRPRGTEDVLPEAAGAWRRIEGIARDLAAQYGFGEVRTPSFEHTELIHHVGESTDVVQRETYDFSDRGARGLTLRPEGTAPVVRAALEGGLFARGLPVKVYYLTMSAFRYERPEAGRLREHHQFGAEIFGAPGPAADAELMALMAAFLAEAGIRDASAHLNSIGCPVCRPAYREALVAYYSARTATLCADCQRRLAQNPLRLLDCKPDREAALGAPHAADHLCAACRDHLDGLCALLQVAGVPFEIDHLLVRGFDYYTRTVFEFVHGGIGSQAALGGGGRYDGLVEALGGPATPAAGFGLGMERLLLALRQEGRAADPDAPCELFVAGPTAAALRLTMAARRAGLRADFDPLGRSLKAQFRYADRLGARIVAVLPEADHGAVTLRDMVAKTQRDVAADRVVDELRQAAGLRPR